MGGYMYMGNLTRKEEMGPQNGSKGPQNRNSCMECRWCKESAGSPDGWFVCGRTGTAYSNAHRECERWEAPDAEA